jgi:hypothetical protein
MNFAPGLIAAAAILAADPSTDEQRVRSTVGRSLPFIQAEGQRWIDEKKCVTCHQVPFMIWALNAARSDTGSRCLMASSRHQEKQKQARGGHSDLLGDLLGGHRIIGGSSRFIRPYNAYEPVTRR